MSSLFNLFATFSPSADICRLRSVNECEYLRDAFGRVLNAKCVY